MSKLTRNTDWKRAGRFARKNAHRFVSPDGAGTHRKWIFDLLRSPETRARIKDEAQLARTALGFNSDPYELVIEDWFGKTLDMIAFGTAVRGFCVRQERLEEQALEAKAEEA